jgi:hypothetical protein
MACKSWRMLGGIVHPRGFHLAHMKPTLKKYIGNLRINKFSSPLLKKFMQPLFLTN